jgi:hypothetical protein
MGIDPNRPDREPSTEEALPKVDLGADEETEEEARERLGPDAAEQGGPNTG